MWLIFRHKKGELKILQEEIKKKIGNLPELFCPKIKISKIINNKTKEFRNNFLSDYVFFYDKSFANKDLMNNLKYLRGLKTMLSNCFEKNPFTLLHLPPTKSVILFQPS